jgi:hypothetical protein
MALLTTPTAAVGARYDSPPEAYSGYQPQTTCATRVKPGTKQLARWIDRNFRGGTPRATLRSCGGGTSEHKDGRAIDWSMRAGKRKHRRIVGNFLRRVFAEDAQGNQHARARRMGIMYIIWNDHMYASYRQFEKAKYRSSACRGAPLRRCSTTLRHRDHVHISLSIPGAKAQTSWYGGAVPDPDPDPDPPTEGGA